MSEVRYNLSTPVKERGYVVSNDFTPRQVDGCVLWLVASLGVASLTWADQSGNSHNATASSGEMPVQTASVVNGQPAMRFDGTKRMTITGTTLGVTGAFTCVLATQCTGNGVGGSQRDSGIFGNGIGAQFQMTHDLGSTRDDYVAGGNSGISFSLGKNVWHVDTFRWVGSTAANGQQDYKNGALQAQRASASAPSSTVDYKIGFEVSGSVFYQGDIAQIALFNRSLSDTERTRVEMAMRRLYGV